MIEKIIILWEFFLNNKKINNKSENIKYKNAALSLLNNTTRFVKIKTKIKK